MFQSHVRTWLYNVQNIGDSQCVQHVVQNVTSALLPAFLFGFDPCNALIEETDQTTSHDQMGEYQCVWYRDLAPTSNDQV